MYNEYYDRQRHYRSSIKKYRIFPITLAGILVFALIMFLAGLLWSIVAYMLIQEPQETAYIPYIIYFLSLAAGCTTAAAICRGTSMIPAVSVAVFAVILSAVMSGFAEMNYWGLLLKTVLSLLLAFVITVIAKAIGGRENRNINLRGELKF